MAKEEKVSPGWKRALKEADVTLTLPGGIPLMFRKIPAGEFWMGSRGYSANEEPRHRVEITQPFYLGTFPITQQQFAAFRPDHRNSSLFSPNHPADMLNWNDAMAFCSFLDAAFSKDLPNGYSVTLPSEAQWEYCCQVGTFAEYSTGDGEEALASAGWFSSTSGGLVHCVGELSPNDFGIYDIHGNVWEWCRDSRVDVAYKMRGTNSKNPEFDSTGDDFVCSLRGGSSFYSAWYCRASYRGWGYPGDRAKARGFRICLNFDLCQPNSEPEV